MDEERLELSCIAAYAPKAYVYTNSTTRPGKNCPSSPSTASDFIEPPHRTSLYASSVLEIFLVYDELSNFSIHYILKSIISDLGRIGKIRTEICPSFLHNIRVQSRLVRNIPNKNSSFILTKFLDTEHESWCNRATDNSPQPLNKGLVGILFAADRSVP